MLSKSYFLAKFRFDTADNEPAKNLQNFANNYYFPNFANGARRGKPLLVSLVRRRSPCHRAESGRGACRRTCPPGEAPPVLIRCLLRCDFFRFFFNCRRTRLEGTPRPRLLGPKSESIRCAFFAWKSRGVSLGRNNPSAL